MTDTDYPTTYPATYTAFGKLLDEELAMAFIIQDEEFEIFLCDELGLNREDA